MNTNQAPFLNLEKILQDVFGYSHFKPLQKEIIEAILTNSHVFAQLITGAGKSLCFQIPAILTNGITIVISPLMALMHEQVNVLNDNQIAASYLDSSQTHEEQNEIYQKLLQKKFKLLYIAPERFKSKLFLHTLQQIQIDRFIIDEAHCISQWGHDFRKDYLNLIRLQEWFPNIQRVALTATADAHTKNDIIHSLALNPVKEFYHFSHRENFQHFFIEKNNSKKQLLNFLKQRPDNECGIVYCFSRNQVEKIAQFLSNEGFITYKYHAGLEIHIRENNQKLFNQADKGIMIATIAFGLGINKSNIRFVAHLCLPQSIEHYIQESGRAGRDGLPAVSWVCYGLNDFILQNERIKLSDLSSKQKNIKLHKLRKMLELCDCLICRECFIQQYFGLKTNHFDCSYSNQKQNLYEASIEVLKLLSAAYYTHQNASITEIIQIIQGKNQLLLEKYALHNAKIFGIDTQTTTKFWRFIIRQSIGAQLIDIYHKNQIVILTSQSIEFLKKKPKIFFNRKKSSEIYDFHYILLTEREKILYKNLINFRKQLTIKKNILNEQVFDDYILQEIIKIKPKDLKSLALIDGFNQHKIAWLGNEILTICHNVMHIKQNQLLDDSLF